MLSMTKIFFSALVAASAVQAVTYADVLNDLKAADNTTQTLTSNFKAYTGTGSQSLIIRSNVNKHVSQVNTATSNTQSSTQPTIDQATVVYNYFCTSPLVIDVKALLNAAVSKKTTFQSAGTLSEICSSLRSIAAAFNQFLDAQIAKAPNADLKKKWTDCKTAVNNALNQALAALGCTSK